MYHIQIFNLFLVELFKHVDSNYNFRVAIFDIDAGMRSIIFGCSRKSQRKSKGLQVRGRIQDSLQNMRL